MEVRFWAATDQGQTRDHNEDNFLVDKKLNLFIVADGMGGHAAGEVASSVAVREVRRVIAERRQVVETYESEGSATGRQAVLRLLDDAIRSACAKVFDMAQKSPDKKGMGTTTSVLLIAGGRGFIGHVGDSRIYLLRTGQFHQLTEDHSLINELIKRGRLKPGDEFHSPYKNAVTRAVGVYETVEVDTLDFDILPNDNYLLCSDGLSCYLDDETSTDYLEGADVRKIPKRFIDLANACGGKDNITAIVVRLLNAPEDQQREVERLTEVRLKLDTLRSIPLFKYLTYKGLVRVMNITESRGLQPGQVIFEEGTRGDTFYVVLEGRVQISKGGVKLAELRPGGHFGEMAMVDKSPRSASAHAVDAVKLLQIGRQPFYELMREDPVMSVKLLWSFIQVLNARLRMTNVELFNARETIELLRQNQASEILAEMPSLAPAIAGGSVMPVGVTDELIPGFLFVQPDAAQTDPLLRLDLGPATLTVLPEDASRAREAVTMDEELEELEELEDVEALDSERPAPVGPPVPSDGESAMPASFADNRPTIRMQMPPGGVGGSTPDAEAVTDPPADASPEGPQTIELERRPSARAGAAGEPAGSDER